MARQHRCGSRSRQFVAINFLSPAASTVLATKIRILRQCGRDVGMGEAGPAQEQAREKAAAV